MMMKFYMTQLSSEDKKKISNNQVPHPRSYKPHMGSTAAFNISSKSLPILSEVDDFEIYFQGCSAKGALLTGSFDQFNTATDLNGCSGDPCWNDDQDGAGRFLRYSKFAKPNTRSLPLPPNETLKFIDIGLQFTTLLTYSNKVYLFGDFPFGMVSEPMKDSPNGKLLLVELNRQDGTHTVMADSFPTEPVEMFCGEQFVTVRDCRDRIYYCGIEGFGTCSSEWFYCFVDLQLQATIENQSENIDLLNGKITHFRVGGRHICICIDNHAILSIGANYYGQLCNDRNDSSPEVGDDTPNIQQYKFQRSLWNRTKQYRVMDIGCSGNMTCIVTTCGKIFKTGNVPHLQGENGTLYEIKLDGIPLAVSGTWTHILIHTNQNNVATISETHEIDNITPISFTYNVRPAELRFSRGTNPNGDYYLLTFDTIYNRSGGQVLKTSLPIYFCKVTSEITMILCGSGRAGKTVREFWKNLHNCKRLHDISIHAQSTEWL
ncbi:hypothetical protein C9374_012931 [Naegleria lovaniensis]|uniref:Uncharacterized protein n=1 Tax=Naegleria lovaniensis TaxID=51637 RepID=A0AA88GDT9_NAELO|nr:uncharacterized protein C9374_012931 [Naegleria lovaniensis]KAG2372988.1 hypothetical protein C9374_012931 [Naegleria lovaniensis]